MTFNGMILVSSMALLSFSVLNLVNVAFHCRFGGPWWTRGPGAYLRSFGGYLGQALVFVWDGALGGDSASVSRGFLARAGGLLILAGRLSAILKS